MWLGFSVPHRVTLLGAVPANPALDGFRDPSISSASSTSTVGAGLAPRAITSPGALSKTGSHPPCATASGTDAATRYRVAASATPPRPGDRVARGCVPCRFSSAGISRRLGDRSIRPRGSELSTKYSTAYVNRSVSVGSVARYNVSARHRLTATLLHVRSQRSHIWNPPLICPETTSVNGSA